MTNDTKAPDWEGFGRDLLEEWPVRDLTDGELFDAALRHGLIHEIPGGYDPDKHIDSECICPESGDPWYEYSFGFERSHDLHLSLVAAAYEGAALKMNYMRQDAAEAGYWAECDAYEQAEKEIRSRTPADAQAALEARDKRIREKAYTQGVKEAARLFREHGDTDVVLALIEKEQTDEQRK